MTITNNLKPNNSNNQEIPASTNNLNLINLILTTMVGGLIDSKEHYNQSKRNVS